MLTYAEFFPSSAAASIYLFKPPYSIGSVPSLSGYAVAYRWRSLPRLCRHRASTPQDSSKRMLPWQVTMDQLICIFLSHTHFWYEVGMLKVPQAHQCRYSAAFSIERDDGDYLPCTSSTTLTCRGSALLLWSFLPNLGKGVSHHQIEIGSERYT